jgi:dolichol-phosphate mannosyltransferase
MRTVPRNQNVTLDIVIPVYNEEAVLPLLATRLEKVFSTENQSKYGLKWVRLLFIDDGSVDHSIERLMQIELRHCKARVVRFSRNFGHQAAVSCGLASSEADLVAVIDADLQDPPDLILQMIALWREGHEVVYGIRRHREGNPLKNLAYWLFYRIYKFLSPINVPENSGDFCLMGRCVVDAMKQLPERVLFIRALRAWVGFKQTGIEYDRPERKAGKSKYSLRRLYELATDGIVALSLRPLQLAQLVSVLYMIVSCCIGAIILFRLSAGLIVDFVLWLVLLIILFSNSVVLLCLYILGAYVGRSYLETKERPAYIVCERLQLSGDDRLSE